MFASARTGRKNPVKTGFTFDRLSFDHLSIFDRQAFCFDNRFFR